MLTYIYQLFFGKTQNLANTLVFGVTTKDTTFNIDIKDNNLVISQFNEKLNEQNTTSIPIDINYTKDMKQSEISEDNYEMQWSNYNQITKFFPNNELIKKYDLYSSQIGKMQKYTNDLNNLKLKKVTIDIIENDDALSVYEKHINNQNKLLLEEIEISIITKQKLLDEINSMDNTIEIEYREYINNINKLIIDNDLERYITSDNLKSTINFYSWLRDNFTKLYVYNSIPETTHLTNAITNMDKTINIAKIITYEKQMIHKNEILYNKQLNYNLLS